MNMEMRNSVVFRGNEELFYRVQIAENFFTRLRGLLGRRVLQIGEGLLIRPCGSIHTFWMRFPIDAVYLDNRMQVVGIDKNLKPSRVGSRVRGACAVLEIGSGEADRSDIIKGQTLGVFEEYQEERSC